MCIASDNEPEKKLISFTQKDILFSSSFTFM